MASTAQKIIDRTRPLLIDPDGVRWTDAELLRYASDAQRAIVALVPTETQTTAMLALAAGVRQSIPSTGLQLLGVYRNQNGRSVRMVTRDVLDDNNPTWPTDTASATVVAFFPDPTDARAFYVYPANTGTGTVEVSYSVEPVDLAATSTALSVRDIFIPAITSYVMHMAHLKDSDYAGGATLANQHMAEFSAFMSAQKVAVS